MAMTFLYYMESMLHPLAYPLSLVIAFGPLTQSAQSARPVYMGQIGGPVWRQSRHDGSYSLMILT